MDKCKSCGKKFEYWKIYEAFFKNKTDDIKCPHCEQSHELRGGCWLIGNFIYFGLPLFILIVVMRKIGFLQRSFLYVSIIIVLSFFVPFIYRFKIKGVVSDKIVRKVKVPGTKKGDR